MVKDFNGTTFQPVSIADFSTRISFSAHEASYAASGWFEAGLSVESPWASGSVKGSSAWSSKQYSKHTELHITGRWYFSMCKIYLQDDAQPHPAFVKAVKQALEATSNDLRQKALREVFRKWGQSYATVVEMGGLQYMNAVRTTDDTVGASLAQYCHGTVI